MVTSLKKAQGPEAGGEELQNPARPGLATVPGWPRPVKVLTKGTVERYTGTIMSHLDKVVAAYMDGIALAWCAYLYWRKWRTAAQKRADEQRPRCVY